MRLIKLSVFQFRLYESVEIEFDPHLNVIQGFNGQGKTSFIEGINLLSSFKSFRNAKNIELIGHGLDQARVLGVVEKKSLQFELEVNVWPHRKQALVNRKHCKFLSEYLGKLNSVSFTPADIEIVRGVPEFRRNWIDKVAQIYEPMHADILYDYGKILDQRNKLLKDSMKFRQKLDEAQLQLWTEQLAEKGEKIICNRIGAARQIQPKIERFHELISNEKTPVFIEYFYSFEDENLSGQTSLIDDKFLLLKHEQARAKDIALGTTTVGPHRDDLGFMIKSFSARAFGSQGEVRSIVLAMRLAEVEAYLEKTGDHPVLLIDDFSSELDQKRRAFLLNYLNTSACQVFLTTTENIDKGKIFEVSEGRINAHVDKHTVSRQQQL